VAGFLVMAAAALAAAGAQPAPNEGRPAALSALLQCRGITDEAARLACFDNAAAAFETARVRGDVLVVDRQQVRRTRRRLFGLALPDFNIFGGGERAEDQPQSVEGEIGGVSYDGGRGGWVLTLRDGAVWAQTDNTTLAVEPRPGHRVVIKRGALGSYMMQVNRQPGIRVRRVR
jgi:hypothetical protein